LRGFIYGKGITVEILHAFVLEDTMEGLPKYFYLVKANYAAEGTVQGMIRNG